MPSLTALFVLFLLITVQSVEYFTSLQLTRSFPFGQYYTTIFIGNPPQAQSVVIDNYQKMLILNCKDCLSCHESERHEGYRFNDSLSSKEIQCKDQISPCRGYCNKKASTQVCKIDNSDYFGKYSVKMVSDEVRMVQIFEGQAAKPYYGCIVSEDLERTYDQNGILGLALSQSNIFNSLFHLDSNDYIKQIGFCLSGETGFLQIGMIPNFNKQEYVSLRMASDNTYGLAGVQDILFGGMSIKQDYSLKTLGVMIMIRSPYTILPGKAFSQVKDKIRKACSVDRLCEVQTTWQEEHRKNMTCISFNKQVDLDAVFPSLEFKFQGYEVSWRASEYLVPGQPSNTSDILSQFQDYYCLTFMNQTKIEKYALGTNFLQKKHVIFDVQSSTIMIKDNYDCNQRKILVIKRTMNYFPFMIVAIALFGRSFMVKIIRICRLKMKKTDETLNEQSTQKNKSECLDLK